MMMTMMTMTTISQATTRDIGSRQCITQVNRDEVSKVIRELCEPNPDSRGHPRTRSRLGNPYALDRYVSLFDRLAQRAEYGLVGS